MTPLPATRPRILGRSLRSRGWHGLGGLVLILWAAGCEFPGEPHLADRPVPPQEVTDFHTLFRRSCAGCHGAEGTLGPAPPLNDPAFLAIVPDAELSRLVRDGRPGTLMPGFAPSAGGSLTDEQVRIVATGLKTALSGNTTPAPSLPPYAVGPGDADRGQKIFDRACAGCHGERGQGGEMAGAINDPAFLSLTSDQLLRRIIITGRPDLEMPGYADSSGRDDGFVPLTSPEIDDLVALLARWRGSTDRKSTVAAAADSR